MAIVAPAWNIIYSPGLLTGIGGSVIYSTKKALRAAGMIQMHILRQPLWVLFCLRLLPGAGLPSAGLSYCFYRFASAALPYWLAMPRTELVTALCAAALMQKYIAAG